MRGLDHGAIAPTEPSTNKTAFYIDQLSRTIRKPPPIPWRHRYSEVAAPIGAGNYIRAALHRCNISHPSLNDLKCIDIAAQIARLPNSIVGMTPTTSPVSDDCCPERNRPWPSQGAAFSLESKFPHHRVDAQASGHTDRSFVQRKTTGDVFLKSSRPVLTWLPHPRATL